MVHNIVVFYMQPMIDEIKKEAKESMDAARYVKDELHRASKFADAAHTYMEATSKTLHAAHELKPELSKIGRQIEKDAARARRAASRAVMVLKDASTGIPWEERAQDHHAARRRVHAPAVQSDNAEAIRNAVIAKQDKRRMRVREIIEHAMTSPNNPFPGVSDEYYSKLLSRLCFAVNSFIEDEMDGEE